jgi:hypothetical protein
MGRRAGWMWWSMVLVLVAAGCAPRERAPVVTPMPATGPTAVAVLPFRVGGELDPNAAFAARSDLPPVPDDVGERSAATLSQALARNGVATVDPARVLAATPPPGAARYDAALAARVAQSVSARLAVLGALTRFVEREGSAWGASAPATVWYQAMLVDGLSGTVLDRQRFEHTQQPLSQNVLELPRFLQGGGRWVTRQEMLDGALTETGGRLARVIRGVPVGP